MALEILLGKIVSEGAKEILISAGTHLFNKMISQKSSERMIVNSGQFIAGFEAGSEKFLNDMGMVLSEDNMVALARELESDSGYTYKERLLNGLLRLMDKYDIPHDEAVAYATKLMFMILEQLPEVAPQKYDRLFQQEWKDEQDKALKALSSKIDKINDELKVYNANSLQIYSASQLDMQIRSETINPKIGIDFFEIDDDNFRETFAKVRNEEIVRVRARCREEAIYCIINELWRSGEERPVFIVKNVNDWKRLTTMSESGNIYIPWFYEDSICAIDNNTNIFIYTDGLPSFSGDEIVLRPRTYWTICRGLERAGMHINEANNLVNETHGLYIPMKKKIFNGQYLKKPEWLDGLPEKIRLTCLLIGQWTDADGDKQIISELSGVAYDKFIDMIMPYSNGEDPFILVVSEHGKKVYYLASVENSWEYLDVSTDNSIWMTFRNLFIEVLNESEKLFTYNYEERILAELKGEKLFFSGVIRNGMTRSVIMKAYYRNDLRFQAALDSLVAEVLDYIKSEEQWRYISHFFGDLCEMSPKAVLDRLFKELNNTTGLMALFEKQSSDILFGKNDYISILFGVDEFLVQNEYAARGYEWLLRLDDKSYQYNSNSPKDSIEKVLCVWHNFSVYTTSKDKTHAAKLALQLDRNAWDYVYNALPCGTGHTMIGNIHGPKYRYHITDSSVTRAQLRETIEQYVKLLVNNANFSPERWEKLLKISEELPDYMTDRIIESMLDEVIQMTDIEQMKLKNAIRRLIYRHRYFVDAEWAMGEEKITRYERLLDEIRINTIEYEYEYIFEENRDIILLNPIPYNRNNEYNLNEKLQNTIIKDKIIEFRAKNLDIATLAKVCAKQKRSNLGIYIAKFGEEKDFDRCIFKELYQAQDTRTMALDYCYEIAYSDSETFYKVMDMEDELQYCDTFIAGIYCIQAIHAKGIPEIAYATDNIKIIYWKEYRQIRPDYYMWALGECKKYGNVGSYIQLLYMADRNLNFKIEDKYNYILGVNNMKYDCNTPVTRYYLSELLKPLQEYYMEDEEKANKIAEIEVSFFNILHWGNMRCFQAKIKRTPEVYAELVSILYRKDGDEVLVEYTEDEKKYINVMHELFTIAHFCPAEKDGIVGTYELEQWVAQFRELLKHNNQSSLFGLLLGRLWVYSPVGEDNHYPCEAVREIIEQYSDDDMKSEYRVALFNKRGVFSPSAGREERIIAQGYKDNADYLKLEYPITAGIFYDLYHSYLVDAESERVRSENGYV